VVEGEPRLEQVEQGAAICGGRSLLVFQVLLAIVDLNARPQEADDALEVFLAHVLARFRDPPALRALDNPGVPVLVAQSITAGTMRGVRAPMRMMTADAFNPIAHRAIEKNDRDGLK